MRERISALMGFVRNSLSFLLCFSLPMSAVAFDWSIATSVLSSKEQFRTGSGTSNGSLFENRQLALWLRYYQPVSQDFFIGPFLSYENGARKMCGYEIDSNGVLNPVSCHSGSYHQFWIGPAFQYRLSSFFLEAQYVLFGRRGDTLYPDASFHTHFLKAWVFTPGARIKINEMMSLDLRIEYRFLYYSPEGSASLSSDSFYGNQAIRPQIGISGVF